MMLSAADVGSDDLTRREDASFGRNEFPFWTISYFSWGWVCCCKWLTLFKRRKTRWCCWWCIGYLLHVIYDSYCLFFFWSSWGSFPSFDVYHFSLSIQATRHKRAANCGQLFCAFFNLRANTLRTATRPHKMPQTLKNKDFGPAMCPI